MNVCMMTNTYLPHVGGVARSVHTFAEQYREKGHATLVVAPTFPGAQKDEIGVIRMPAIQQFNGSDFSVRLAIPGYISDKIDRFGPDVIHSHHPFLMGDTAFRVARYRELPLVFTHHTLYERYTHYVPFDSDVMKQLAIKLSTHYANACSLVIAPSESIADLITDRGVKSRVEVVPTGVNVGFFQGGDPRRGRQAHNIPPDAYVVGHVGRLAPEKNLDYLAAAVAKFLKHRSEAWFLVVGDGPSREAIERRCHNAGAGDRLVMTGKLSGQALADAYRSMDVFAFASHTETQGMVVAEALAADVPVVALDASGIREVVEHDENGLLLAEDATEDTFATALATTLTLPQEKARAWREAAERTARRFSQERCAGRLLELYGQLAGHRHSYQLRLGDAWEQLRLRLAAEWELMQGKASALSDSLFQNHDRGES